MTGYAEHMQPAMHYATSEAHSPLTGFLCSMEISQWSYIERIDVCHIFTIKPYYEPRGRMQSVAPHVNTQSEPVCNGRYC